MRFAPFTGGGRRLAALTAPALALAMQPVLLLSPAHADDISRCTGQDRVVERSVRLVSSTFNLTHGDLLDLGRGIGYHKSRTIEVTKVYTASASGTVETSGSVSWKIAKLDAKTSLTLATAGEHTKKTSVTEDFDVAKADRNRLILFYRGSQVVKGRWYQLTCSRVPGKGTERRGSVVSFSPIPRHGAFECDPDLYKKGSVRYRLSVQAGCS